MAYIPPASSAVNFNATADGYVAPASSAVNFSFLAGVIHDVAAAATVLSGASITAVRALKRTLSTVALVAGAAASKAIRTYTQVLTTIVVGIPFAQLTRVYMMPLVAQALTAATKTRDYFLVGAASVQSTGRRVRALVATWASAVVTAPTTTAIQILAQILTATATASGAKLRAFSRTATSAVSAAAYKVRAFPMKIWTAVWPSARRIRRLSSSSAAGSSVLPSRSRAIHVAHDLVLRAQALRARMFGRLRSGAIKARGARSRLVERARQLRVSVTAQRKRIVSLASVAVAHTVTTLQLFSTKVVMLAASIASTARLSRVYRKVQRVSAGASAWAQAVLIGFRIDPYAMFRLKERGTGWVARFIRAVRDD